jgi:hypothetical protein
MEAGEMEVANGLGIVDLGTTDGINAALSSKIPEHYFSKAQLCSILRITL